MKLLRFCLFLLIPSFSTWSLATDSTREKVDHEVSPQAFFFPAQLNGVQTNITELSYFFSDDRRTLTIGSVEYRHDSLMIQVLPIAEGDFLFLVDWPTELISRGQLVRIEKGKATWELEIDDEAIRRWKRQRNTLNLPSAIKEQALKAGYGFHIYEKDLLANFPARRPFMFCFVDPPTKGSHRACSGGQVIVQQAGKTQLRRLAGNSSPGVSINGRSAPLRGIFPYEAQQKQIQFRSRLANGATYQFASQPSDLQVVDAIHLDDSKQILVRGSGAPPIGNVRFSERPRGISPLMEHSLYPEAPRLWSLRIPSSESFLYQKGLQGGIFRHPIFLERMPTPAHRIYSPTKKVQGTYLSQPRLEIEPPRSGELAVTDAQRLENRSTESDTQVWEFEHDEKGRIKTYSATITRDRSVYTAGIPIYRGYPYEVSGMLGGAAQIESLAFAGEFRFYSWFENFLGCSNRLFCYQRWGARARYFLSNSVVSIAGADDASLTVSSLQTDMYYRLAPGVWGVDEFVGLVFGFQDKAFNDFASKRLGAGFTWGRPLPRIFQPMFDIVPFMRYPKWVHLDFTYYPLSLDENVNLNVNWTLNFQGRIHWGEQLYGEVGFGMYNADYIMISEMQNVVSQAAFGTMGLGLRF